MKRRFFNNSKVCTDCGREFKRYSKCCPKWKIVLRPGVNIDIPFAEYANESKKIG